VADLGGNNGNPLLGNEDGTFEGRLGLWGSRFETISAFTLVTPDDSLAIRKMALSIGFQDSVPFLLAIQATGL
jgi:hypothetical protein